MSFTRFFRRGTVILIPLFLFSACNLGTQPAGPVTAETSAVSAAIPSTAISPTIQSTAESIPAGTAAPLCSTSVTGGFTLCVQGLTAGQTVAIHPGGSIAFSATVTGAAVPGIGFSVDNGTFTKFENNTAGGSTFTAEFSWSPAAGSRTYALHLDAVMADKSDSASLDWSVNVTGLAVTTVTPSLAPGEVPEAVRALMLETFAKQWGLTLPFPAIAKKFRGPGAIDPWVSTAYVGRMLYEIDSYPDGHVETFATPADPNAVVDLKTSYFKQPICWPAGRYSMLVVFLDFHNLTFTSDQLMTDLAQATDKVNREYSAYPQAGPGSAPILQIQTRGVLIPVPALDPATHLITLDQVRNLTGMNLDDYDWVTQVDLDAASSARQAWGGVGPTTSFGYAYNNCPAKKAGINIYITIDNTGELTDATLDNRLASTMLAHEVFHLFGYPASHIWPCTDGPQKDGSDSCGDTAIPSLMLGWMDTDGDGIPEIMDPMPYGLAAP